MYTCRDAVTAPACPTFLQTGTGAMRGTISLNVVGEENSFAQAHHSLSFHGKALTVAMRFY